MIRLKFLPLRRLFPAFANLFTRGHKDDVDPGFNLYDYADRLCTRGWQVPVSMPK